MSNREIPNLHKKIDVLISENERWTAKINALRAASDNLSETKPDSAAETKAKQRMKKTLKEVRSAQEAVALITDELNSVLHNNPIRSRSRKHTRSRSGSKGSLPSFSPPSPPRRKVIPGAPAAGGRRTKKRRGRKC